MSNLLSGALGALVGGILALVASLIATKKQESQARLQASYAAGGEILLDMLKIKQGMWDVREQPVSDRTLPLQSVYAAAERILVVHNIVIADKEIRHRVNVLIDLVNTWYANILRYPGQAIEQDDVSQIISNMKYVGDSIAAHLDGLSATKVQAPGRPEDSAFGASSTN